MKYSEILNECKRERDEFRKLIAAANKKAGWFMGNSLMKKETENAQKSIAKKYLELISDNITDLRDELDDYDFAPIFDLYCAYNDGEEISLDQLPDEVII